MFLQDLSAHFYLFPFIFLPFPSLSTQQWVVTGFPNVDKNQPNSLIFRFNVYHPQL